MFGTTGLQDYPIQVRVSENCHARPDTFVAIIAHELSHVLLASLWHPQKDRELQADLVPLLLGFRDIVWIGRRTIKYTASESTTTISRTTYGYLTDSQFNFAYRYVTGILERHQEDKKHLIEIVKQMQAKLKKVERKLAIFCDYFKYLDRRPPTKMREEHAKRVVQLHSQDYSRAWEDRIAAVRSSLVRAVSFVRHLNHYTSDAVDHLKSHTRSLELASDELAQVAGEIGKDIRVLRRYVGFIHRLWGTLWRRT